MSASILQPHLVRIIAIIILLLLYDRTRLPQISSQERSSLAADFLFERFDLPAAPSLASGAERRVRDVHPSLHHIAGWVSFMGASVALNDLDADGLPNDLCSVDPSSDQVLVASVPGTSERYAPFVLQPDPLPYDAGRMAPMGCLPNDMNEDGRLDLLVYYWGRTPIAFLQIEAAHAENDGPIELRPEGFRPVEIVANTNTAAEFEPEIWNTSAATFADFDGDGHTDLLLGNYFQDGARILDPASSGPLEGSMHHSWSRAANGGRDRLLRWESSSVGTDPSVQFKIIDDAFDPETAQGWTLALAAGDLDGDLLPEIYMANDFGPDRLLHNRSEPGKFVFVPLEGRSSLTMPHSKVLGRDSFKGMGAEFGDLNGDAWPDIYVSNIADEYALQESHFAFLSTGKIDEMRAGHAPYEDQSEGLGLSRSGWGWESRLADFNNDGVVEAIQATGFLKGEIDRWPELQELAMSNDQLISSPSSWPRFRVGDDLSGHQHNPFFVRAGDGRYYDLASELGIDQDYLTRGIATADVDGDGDLDFAIANQWEPSYFFRNDCPDCGNFLGIRLLVPASPSASEISRRGRPAIGASARLHLPDGSLRFAQIDGGNGHSGARSSDLFFGLGALPADSLLRVDLEWRAPGGQVYRETLMLEPGWHRVWVELEGESDMEGSSSRPARIPLADRESPPLIHRSARSGPDSL